MGKQLMQSLALSTSRSVESIECRDYPLFILSHNWDRLRTSGRFTAIQGSCNLLSYWSVSVCSNSNFGFCGVGGFFCSFKE